MYEEKSKKDTTKIIIAVLIIVAVVLAGSLIYIYGFGNGGSDNSAVEPNANQQPVVQNNTSDEKPVETTQATQTQPVKTSTPMTIQGGTFSTGSGLSDKTYAKIYVGPEHAGENVKVQIFYSRDGAYLNDGNIVPKTVTSDGYVEVTSADSYKYYPDYAEISLYDSSGDLVDIMNVALSPTSGSQSF